jgi:multimeric flavodoxin WrbA
LKGSEIILKVNCSPRQYGAIKVLREEAREAIQLPPGVEVKGLKITDKAILLNVIVPPNSGAKSQETLYKIITMMFLSLYQILNLAKMLTKKKNA